jgi:hypothetical protein
VCEFSQHLAEEEEQRRAEAEFKVGGLGGCLGIDATYAHHHNSTRDALSEVHIHQIIARHLCSHLVSHAWASPYWWWIDGVALHRLAPCGEASPTRLLPLTSP